MQVIRRWRPTSAHVISLIALFVALGGSAYAVTAGKNTVKSKSIAQGAVKTSDIANKAVSRKKLKAGAVPASAIAGNSIGAAQLGNVVTRRDVQPLNDGTQGAAKANCQPGEQAIGGGGYAGGTDLIQTQSAPRGAGGEDATEGGSIFGWLMVYFNPPGGTGNTTVGAWVICLQ